MKNFTTFKRVLLFLKQYEFENLQKKSNGEHFFKIDEHFPNPRVLGLDEQAPEWSDVVT